MSKQIMDKVVSADQVFVKVSPFTSADLTAGVAIKQETWCFVDNTAGTRLYVNSYDGVVKQKSLPASYPIGDGVAFAKKLVKEGYVATDSLPTGIVLG